jgi:hypothetical protein
MMNKNQILWWLPRLFTTAVVLFIGSFSADAIESGTAPGVALLHLFMHLLPAILLAALLAIAWRWEKIGGIAFITLGLALAPFVYLLNHQRNNFTAAQSIIVVAIINLPVIVSGLLFLASAGRQKYRSGNIH